MRVRDAKEIAIALLIHNDVLRPNWTLSIADNNDSYLIHIIIREVVTPRIAGWIKVK